MKKRLTITIVAGGMLTATLAWSQMGTGRGMGGPGMMMGPGAAGLSMARHHLAMMNGVDPKYAHARNPLVADAANLRAGKALFEKNCASCHGSAGRGDGPASKGLNPAPSDLTVAVKTPIAGDAYLDWTISEGGVPVKSAMPPFKTILSTDDIWKLVLYLRTL